VNVWKWISVNVWNWTSDEQVLVSIIVVLFALIQFIDRIKYG
jgi:hypothetical protein